MKRILQLFLLSLALQCTAQTTINEVTLDTMGRLRWNVSFSKLDLNIEIQRHLKDKWTKIADIGYHIEYLNKLPDSPKSTTVTDSCLVPLNKGKNKYRVVITIPTMLESKEISVNSLVKKNEIYATDNFIRFNNRVSFSIYDANGKEIRKLDIGRMINIADLKTGLYYIVVNKDIYEFIKE